VERSAIVHEAPQRTGPQKGLAVPSFVADAAFRATTAVFAGSVVVLALVVAWQLWLSGRPAFAEFGWNFLVSSDWDPVNDQFGAWPFIYGTLASSAIALLIATPLGLGIAIFLTELSPQRLRAPVAFAVEILASIPSVVYGLWGIFALAPLLREKVYPFFIEHLGKPFFTTPSTGLSLLTAGIILAIMILPTITAITREVFLAVPESLRESARALGATRWETILLAVVRSARPGVVGAVVLGLGRALGETMAVTMVIGNRPEVSLNFLGPSHSMAAVIANEFTEAVSDIHLSALSAVGLLLMGVTLVLNVAAQLLVWWTSHRLKGARA